MNTFITFNLNSWVPVAKNMSYKEKISKFASFVRRKYGSPSVIAIQEVITGGGRYLDEIYNAFEGDYHVIVPPTFDYRLHAKSLVTVTLLKKSDVDQFEVKHLGKCLPNRISYVTAWIDGKPWSILNVYAVQISYFAGRTEEYIAVRKELHEKLWEELLTEAKNQSKERVVILGDLQESSEGSHVKDLISMGYRELILGCPTVRNEIFAEKSIDHILFSEKAWADFNPAGFAMDGDLVNEISDHCLLAVMSA